MRDNNRLIPKYNRRMPTANEILQHLHTLSNPENLAGMARFGINPHDTLGISVYTLREIAKSIPKDHALAQELWASGIHEARLLGSFVDRPEWVTEEQLESWVLDFDSWDVCDQVCDLFGRCSLAYAKAFAWSERPEEFVKRAGFVLMAELAVHDKKAPDASLAQFLPVIAREAYDERNFVKKAVNWALRNIGKRNLALNQQAIAAARQIQQQPTPTARWIAADALRELTSQKVLQRLEKRA